MSDVRRWVEGSDFGAGIGVRLDHLDDTSARLVLPFRSENTNPGDALHGGCAAGLGILGGQALARTVLDDAFSSFHTANCQVSYLAAAIGEDVTATTTLLRRGKELCFADTSVATGAGKPIAHVVTLVRGRATEPTEPPGSDIHPGGDDPGDMGPFIDMMPYSRARGLHVAHMADGRARITMPKGTTNADRSGAFHEGAALGLFDTTGAMAAWAAVGPGDHKASTAGLQAQVIGSLVADDLVGHGVVVARDRELLWADVDVLDPATGHVHVRGTVIYRIVTG